jgi:hypothetical protein
MAPVYTKTQVGLESLRQFPLIFSGRLLGHQSTIIGKSGERSDATELVKSAVRRLAAPLHAAMSPKRGQLYKLSSALHKPLEASIEIVYDVIS